MKQDAVSYHPAPCDIGAVGENKPSESWRGGVLEKDECDIPFDRREKKGAEWMWAGRS